MVQLEEARLCQPAAVALASYTLAQVPAFSLTCAPPAPLRCAFCCCAGSATGSSLVVMSKGTPYTQQSYKVSGEQQQAGRQAGRQGVKQAGGQGAPR